MTSINVQRVLGEEIRRYMHLKDSSKNVYDFSKEIGLHLNTLYNLLKCNLTTRPRDKTYRILSEYFEVDEGYLRSLPYNYKQLRINKDKD